jgi:hypothetical protein
VTDAQVSSTGLVVVEVPILVSVDGFVPTAEHVEQILAALGAKAAAVHHGRAGHALCVALWSRPVPHNRAEGGELCRRL